jgi:hypothetical protein
MGRPESAAPGFFVSPKAVVAKITTAFFIHFFIRTFFRGAGSGMIAERG